MTTIGPSTLEPGSGSGVAAEVAEVGAEVADCRLDVRDPPLDGGVRIAHRAQRKRSESSEEGPKLMLDRFTDHSSLALLLLRRSA